MDKPEVVIKEEVIIKEEIDDEDAPEEMGSPPDGVIQLNDGKAGMEGLDLEKINKIINDTSRGSKFYEHKKKRQDQLRQKLVDIRAQVASLSEDAIAKAEKQVDRLAKELEDKRDLSRVIVHLDMDAFYAAVEMRDKPELKEIPMAVGGSSMLCTSNYVARKYGVRSGMPGFIAKKLCPQLVIVPLNFEKYIEASKEVEQVLTEYDKESLHVSMDEAVLDITTCLAERNSLLSEADQTTPSDLVHEIRAKILEKTGLTASGGIAANGFLAKICSDINKPNSQFFLESSKEEITTFLSFLPTRKVGGIGPVTEDMLRGGLDIENCGDLWKKRGLVHTVFKPATATFLLEASMGIGGSFFSSADRNEDVRKSMSYERTFGKATRKELQVMCQNISDELQKDLRRRGAAGKIITLKIKTTNFEVKTKSRSILDYTCNASAIFTTAWSLYSAYEKEIPNLQLRLMGIRISNLRMNGDDDDEDGGSSKGMKQQTLSQLFAKSTNDGEEGLKKNMDDSIVQPKVKVENSNGVKQENDNTPPAVANCSTSTLKTGSSVICPVCKRKIEITSQEEDDVIINAHIDYCLSVPLMNKILNEESEGQKAYEAYYAASVAKAAAASSSATTPTSTPGPSGAVSAPTKRQLEEGDDAEVPANPNPAKKSNDVKTKTPSNSQPKPTPPNKKRKKSSKFTPRRKKSKNSTQSQPLDAFFKKSS